MPALRSPFAGGDPPAADADPDYLYFLRHVRVDGDAYTLELPGRGASPPTVIKYEGPPEGSSDGECVSDPSPGHLSAGRRPAEEKESSASADAEATPAPAPPDSIEGADEDYRVFLQHTRLVDGQLILEYGGAVVNYDQPGAAGSRAEEKDRQPAEEAAAVSSGTRGAGAGVGRDEAGSNAPAAAVPEKFVWDWRADPSPRREASDGGDEVVDAADAGTPKGVHWEASSSNRRRARRHSDSEGKETELGIIWPTHINLRPDSDFKQRLIQALTKPVARKEYYRLFDTVTIRTPLMKLRQVRNETKFYPTEEMGNSYLDHYPDLAEQIMNSGRRNGLALMRGFLFWLQNNAHEDQFKPWVDDSKDHEVIPLVD